MRIDPESFEEWTAHPLTEALWKAMERLEAQAQAAWVARSWGAGSTDPLELARLRARAAVLAEMRNLTAQQLEDLTE